MDMASEQSIVGGQVDLPGQSLDSIWQGPGMPSQPIFPKGDSVYMMRCYGLLEGGSAIPTIVHTVLFAMQ